MPSKYLHRRIKHRLRWEAAKYWLKLHPQVEVIGIAGSVGKTTTKDLTAAVLSQKFPVVKSRANFDPIFNLPQTALRIRQGNTRFVAELGIDEPGQMAHYFDLVRPTIGVMTELSPEHTDAEHFGSLEAAIAEEWKLIEQLPKNGWAVLNGDNEFIQRMAAKVPANRLLFGFNQGNDVLITDVQQKLEHTKPWLQFTLSGRIEGQFQVPMLGRHNALAATAAVCVGHILGLPLEQLQAGLRQAEPPERRLEVKQTGWGGLLIDDTYNSSPKAAMAAVDVLAGFKNPAAVIVLADMLELNNPAKEHQEVGRYTANQGIGTVLAYGQQAAHICEGYGNTGTCQVMASQDQIIDWLQAHKPPIVLLKGSKATKLSEVAARLATVD